MSGSPKDKMNKLTRIHRVRSLQLGLVQGDEARAQAKLASEDQLARRIGELAAEIAPTPASASAASLIAAAHFRDRLHVSAVNAESRRQAAQAVADRAAEATRAARRDQTAVEKLLDRAKTDAALAAIRALEELPPARGDRHDPC
jgi:hypothetical protein